MARDVVAPADVRQAFVEAGLSVTDWADTHGFRRESVYAVLSGRSKGRRGQAHKIAVALGLKGSRSAAARFLLGSITDATDDKCLVVSSDVEDAPMS